MVFGHLTSMMGSSGHDEDEHKAADPGQGKECREAIRQWWLELQHQLGDELERENNDDKCEPTGNFLAEVENKLQPLLDIVFFLYWNIGQARAEGSVRYIDEEGSLQLFDDLVRNNEDVAIAALTDYMKYRMYTGGADVDAIKEKKVTFVDGKKKACVDKIDKEKADEVSEKLSSAVEGGKPKDLEIAIAEAKANGADVTAAEAKLKEVKEAADTKANEKIQEPVEKAKVALEKAEEGKKEKAEELLKKKTEEAEEATKKRAEEAEQVTKDAEAAAAAAEEEKKTAAEDRTKAEEAAAKEAEESFMEKFREAVDSVVAKMAEDYRKKAFCKRQAACDDFLSHGDGPTMTQLHLNRILTLTDAEKFNGICLKLGFNVDSFSAAAEKIKLEDSDDDDDE